MSLSPAQQADLKRRLATVEVNGSEEPPIVEEPGDVFEVLTARATCQLPDPPESDYLLGPLLVRGNRLVLGAHTGEGKTTLSLAIVRAVTERLELLAWQGTGGRALIIDAEQGLRTVKRRLREAGLEASENVDYIRVPDGLSLDQEPAHIAAVEKALTGGHYSVVLADPLYKLHRGESSEERAAVDLMRRFDAWRLRHHFALIVPMHCRKPAPGAKFTMHDFFGSTAWLRGAEVVIGLQRLRDGYSRLHFFKDRDGDLPTDSKWGLLFDRGQGFRRDPEDENPRLTAAQEVTALLEVQPGMTEAQLMAATGKSERTIRNVLHKMGAVSTRAGTTAPKLWELSEDGEVA